MSTTNIIRAWKDPEYRESLSEAEMALVPENPAGLVELTDEDLEAAAGGAEPIIVTECRRRSFKIKVVEIIWQ